MDVEHGSSMSRVAFVPIPLGRTARVSGRCTLCGAGKGGSGGVRTMATSCAQFQRPRWGRALGASMAALAGETSSTLFTATKGSAAVLEEARSRRLALGFGIP